MGASPETLEHRRLVKERISYIAKLMSEDKWPRWPGSLPFRAALAKQWGVADTTVRNYAMSAHRLLALSEDEKGVLQAQLAKKFFTIGEEALSNVNRVTGLPDYHAGIKAYEQGAKFIGLEPATKVNVSGSFSLEDVEQLRRRIRGEGDESPPQLSTGDEDEDEALDEVASA